MILQATSGLRPSEMLGLLAKDVLLPGLASGELAGVFIGDEICCDAPECWPQLDAVSAELRKLLGPRAVLYLNECVSSALSLPGRISLPAGSSACQRGRLIALLPAGARWHTSGASRAPCRRRSI